MKPLIVTNRDCSIYCYVFATTTKETSYTSSFLTHQYYGCSRLDGFIQSYLY